ncbi:hypothetical protein GCM10023194_79960 [Planotetraspora phitsanulokensis]|uniref:YCII-related domain-containing protein n=1 Tax=Planotetraspora phitsanulokensis TaxID=575192 RepID=A0A8J3XI09_9ACTN|nr:hypothetical protein [Planotetraspora phitsanulokensis]GII41675.1 hypothetical protein Pph01_66780 [Planotetraspora phitsanulokensis]
MTEISDDYMREQLTRAREFVAVLLKAADGYGKEGSDAVIWEHVRHNFALRAEGSLSVVLPVMDDSDLCGVGIFNASVEEVRTLMDDDPGVRAGVFTYEVHPVRGFPGDGLPQ